jgi:hypothetical protein
LTSPLDEIAKRLEHLERRMARLEALAGTGKSKVEQGAQLRAAIEQARAQTSGSASVSKEMRMPPLQQQSAADGAAASASATPPPTLRLAPIPPRPPLDELPDLSLLDEKVEQRKGPAQKIDVRSALEDYPLICAHVQQLWGTTECENYLNTLVIDTRGNRQGFPAPMMEELLYLGRLARALVIINIGGDLWDGYDQAGDRR